MIKYFIVIIITAFVFVLNGGDNIFINGDNIHGLGFLWSSDYFDGVRQGWGDEAKALDSIFAIAAEHFNERSTIILDILGSQELKDCKHNISFSHLYDSMGVSQLALEQYLYHQNDIDKFDYIVGPGTSTESVVMGIIAGVQEIPMMGYWATSPSLSDKNVFPTFARSFPADDSIAVAQAEFFKLQNYTAIGLIFTNDPFGIGFKDALFKECSKRDILVHFVGFNGDDEESIKNAIKSIANLKLNIISAASFSHYYSNIAKYADIFGISGKNKLWLFLTLEDDNTIEDKSIKDISYRKLMLGGIKITPVLLNNGGNENIPYQKLKNAWSSFDQYRLKMNTIYPRLDGYDKFDLTYPENFFSNNNLVQTHMGFEYDAVISMGIAYCKANSTGKAKGKDVFKEIIKLDFIGISGRVKYLENGDRDPSSVTFLVENLRPDINDINGPLKRISSGTWNQEIGWDISSNILYSTGTNQPPNFIDIPNHEKNLISNGAKQFGYVLVAITWLLCIIVTIWLGINRNEKLVKNSQPEFLFLLILGVIISNVSILALMVDEGGLSIMTTDVGCMIFPWFYTIGFMLGYFALFAKTYRILLLFNNSKLRRRFISAKPVLLSVASVLIAESIILIAWTIEAPLVWKREIVYMDSFNNPIESRAACVASNSNTIIFVGFITAFHILALGFGAYVSAAAREIPQEFQEGRWIALAMGSTFQIFLIGVPTVIAVYSSSSFARFICMSLIVFVTNIAMLGFIFIPKLFNESSLFLNDASHSSGSGTSNTNRASKKGGVVSPPGNATAVASGNIL